MEFTDKNESENIDIEEPDNEIEEEEENIYDSDLEAPSDNDEPDLTVEDNINTEKDTNSGSKNTSTEENKKYNYNIYDYNIEEGDNLESLNKFENDLTDNHITNYHAECLSKNYNEIKMLINITKNKNNIIIDEFHKTLPILTKYEKTKVLGIRVKQLNTGSKSYITVDEKILDNYVIAYLELEQKKLPFIIERPLSNNTFEYWKLNDLELLD